MSHSNAVRSRFLSGLRAGVPIILGFIPVGIAYAILARQVGFTFAETVSMSLFVFAGASQIMAVGMYAQGAAVAAVILATFIINLRHIIMSTCVFERMDKAKTSAKLLAAFGVTDETFAVFTTNKEGESSVPYFLGLALGAYSSWVISSAVGAAASTLLPDIVSASMGIALYAMFIGLLVPNVKKNLRLGLLVIMTAAVNSVLTQFMASSWALIVSTIACAAVGVLFVRDEKGDKKEGAPDEG